MVNKERTTTHRPQKIILIGYRACGKTSVGRELAAALGWDFLDLDAEVVRRAGMPIAEMVASGGWELFRAREREQLAALIPRRRLVAATGGGAVLHDELWPELRRDSLVIWLTAEPATIAARLAADPATAGQRPALTDQGLLAEIATVLAQRHPLYQQAAHLTIATDTTEQPAPAAIARQILLDHNL